MHLKRLDVVGFKSFAERVGIDFVPGITAVVGPNGSGKSNIIDAIRWVLGEQSAKSLRGAKMEDVIFSGSDSRKPLNFAEVTLTLENEDRFLPIDYQEVSVTRRVFRSGESEFLINKQPCRLKDIVDLFMDSGLGREAFSIISQGKVDEILNSKPEERRTIFEEAAGVLKYKNRKKKAEIKLTETEENLNRVRDIIHELESQLEPLRIQSSMAKDFLQKKEELEKFEVSLIVYEIQNLYKKWETLSVQLEEHKKDELSLTSALQTKEAKIEEIRDQIDALDESIQDLQGLLLNASEELEKLEGKKEVLKERKKNAVKNKELLERNIEDLTDKINVLRENKEKQEELVYKMEQEVFSLQNALKEKQEKTRFFNENLEDKIESLKSDYIEILNVQASSKNELQNIEQQLNQQSAHAARLEQEKEKYVKELKIIKEKKGKILDSLTDIQKKLKEQIAFFQREQENLESLKSQYEEQRNTLYQAYQYVQKARSRKDMLEEMEEDYSGFNQGVKEVLKARGKNLEGIEGAIAELIQVPKEYEIAIETSLGGSMQHIIVDNEENGRKAIAYLKQHAYGRATFLPLNVIKGKSLTPAQVKTVNNHPSFVGIASNLVHYDFKYKEIMDNLLGTVVITKDLKGANEMAKILHYRYRFVTLEGDVVSPGGAMTGGSVKRKTSSLLSRKGELEELKGKLCQMEKKTAALEDKVKHLKDSVQNQEKHLEKLRKHGEQLRLKEQSIKGHLREMDLEERNIIEKLEIYDLDQSQLREERKFLASKKQELIVYLNKLQDDIRSLNEQIEELTQQKNTEMTSKETLFDEINKLKITIASKNEQFNHAKEKLSDNIHDLKETSRRRTEQQKKLNSILEEMSDHTEGEGYLEKSAERKLQDKNEINKLILSRREERMSLTSQLEDAETEIKELKRQQKGMNVVLKDEEVQLNRLDVELENLLAQLREEYLLSFEGAKEKYPLDISVEEARKKVKLIKMSIDELGTVNLGAIDEYDRVSERYDFLTKQKNDLEEAKDTLFQVIDEMDEEMKKRFGHTFNEVRTHFEPVFRELFGGGRADLRLTDPEDLLMTGVDIVAQPPGKKLQSLSLLSGGERALTAIALLFAILRVRPVPFCILDEVEAALDEANVFRFIEYLKRYKSATQFIIITHRKGTMEGADCLYGITMQESGVSKLVSVRLEDSRELVES